MHTQRKDHVKTQRRQLYASQKEKSWGKKSILSIPWSWTSKLQNYNKINFCSLGNLVVLWKGRKKRETGKSVMERYFSLSPKASQTQRNEKRSFKTSGIVVVCSRYEMGYVESCKPLGEPKLWPGLHSLDGAYRMIWSEKETLRNWVSCILFP